VVEPRVLPDDGIGQAAVLGYHAYVVSAGCDEGGYAPDGPQTRSTVVYFASEADAQAFRLLANTEVIRESAIEVTKVRTWCV
jgi:hypothetical protein